jgi:hypothetical protein
MDPLTLANSLIALFTPMLNKAGEEFGGQAGKVVFEGVRALFLKLKERWSGDTFAQQTVARFERDPDRYANYLEDLLVERLGADDALAAELTQRLIEIKAIGPELRVVQRIQVAQDITGVDADEITAGSMYVEQQVHQAHEVKGAVIRRFGPAS